MGIASQIPEDLLGSAEGRLGVDNPLLLAQAGDQILEVGRVSEIAELSVEFEALLGECLFEIGEELAAKQATEWAHRQQELLPTTDPSLPIGRQSPRRHYTMQVRMMFQPLCSGVEHGQETDLGAQSLRIGGQLPEGFGRGPEQNPIQHPRILQGQRRELPWQGEHDVAVGNGQQFLRPVRQPLIAGSAVAVWAMPIAARVEGSDLVGTVVTLFDVRAESGGLAGADGPECLSLLSRECVSPAIKELLTVLAKDIGDFEPMFGHRRRPSSSDSAISITVRLSRGLTVARSV